MSDSLVNLTGTALSLFGFVTLTVLLLSTCLEALKAVVRSQQGEGDYSELLRTVVTRLPLIIILGLMCFSGNWITKTLTTAVTSMLGDALTPRSTVTEVLNQSNPTSRVAPSVLPVDKPKVVVKEVVKEVVVEKEVSRTTNWTAILIVALLVLGVCSGLVMWWRHSRQTQYTEYLFKSKPKAKPPTTERKAGTFLVSGNISESKL
jgi:hypothetical protein